MLQAIFCTNSGRKRIRLREIGALLAMAALHCSGIYLIGDREI